MKTLRLNRYALQKGHGVGSIFRTIGKFFMPVAKTLFGTTKPLLKKVGKSIGQEVLNVGAETVGDIVSGKNVKESLKRNIKSGGKRVINKAKNEGQGIISNDIKVATTKRKPQSTKGPPAKRVKRRRKNKGPKTIFD